MRVQDVMTRHVVTVQPDCTVKAAAALLAEHGFTALPVVSDDRLVGLLTEAAALEGRLPADPRYRTIADDTRTVPPPTVADVMTAPMAASRHTDIAALAARMVVSGHRSMPVTADGRSDGDLIGIVTRRDILRVLARPDTDIAADIRRHLAMLGGPGRYTVRVHDGVAAILDALDRPEELHTAHVVAEAVPGAIRARVDGPDAIT